MYMPSKFTIDLCFTVQGLPNISASVVSQKYVVLISAKNVIPRSPENFRDDEGIF